MKRHWLPAPRRAPMDHGSAAAAGRRRIIRSITLVALAGLAWYAWSAGVFDPESLAREAANGKHWTCLILISFGLMLVCAATPLPAEALAVANGICFGPLAGAVVTWLSATTGATIVFVSSRRLLAAAGALPGARTGQPGWISRLERCSNRGLLLARLIPLVPFFTLNFGAALLPVRTRDYVLISALAILPHALIFPALGAFLGS